MNEETTKKEPNIFENIECRIHDLDYIISEAAMKVMKCVDALDGAEPTDPTEAIGQEAPGTYFGKIEVALNRAEHSADKLRHEVGRLTIIFK